MKNGWADPEHVGKVTISILDILSGLFHKEAKKKDDAKDYDLLVKLSQAAGYQAQLYSGLQKSHEFARRLQRLEKDMNTYTPEETALKNNPVLIEENNLKNQKSWR